MGKKGTRFLVLHTNPNADGLKNLFAELHELYIKALMNPLQFINSALASPVFDIKVRQLVKKYSS